MAVNETNTPTKSDAPSGRGDDFGGRHVIIGLNVLISVLVATAIVGIVQWGGYQKHAQADLTDQGVNSLSEGTERLLDGLDESVRLSSLYFTTDLEEDDQSKYRNKVSDLLDLYQSANRSKIEVEKFNPLQDHAKRERFTERLYGLETFKKQTGPYSELIERFRGDIAGKMTELVQSELDTISAMVSSAEEGEEKDVLSQIQLLFDRSSRDVGFAIQEIDDAVSGPQPRYETAQGVISRVAGNVKKDLSTIIDFGVKHLDSGRSVSDSLRSFLDGAEDRYAAVIGSLEGIIEDAQELPRLELAEVLRRIGPTTNALVVETKVSAKVIEFSDIWPPVNPNIPPSAAKFGQRSFKGEDKLTSAILQLTEKEKTAVIFVRFGGAPLFFAMPGSGQQAGYVQLKELLEDANFEVREWDVASAETPPEIDPPPTRELFVVLRPTTPPPPNQFNQMQQQQQFTEMHKDRVLGRLGENPRAIFLAGWSPGPFGAFPEPYQYDSFLNDEYGIHVSHDLLLLNALLGEKPGEFSLSQRSLYQSRFSRGDHILVNGMGGQQATLPFVSPLDIAANLPEGVTVDKLLWCEQTENLWGVKNVQNYVEQARTMKGVQKAAEDVYGPFNVAVAAEKGESKIVVISSRDCMLDRFAMAPTMMLTSQGLALRQANPGNVQLFLNSLHWLNDKTDWMNVGAPVNVATLEIDEGPALTFVRTFVFSIWPGMALLCGVVAWWVRRR